MVKQHHENSSWPTQLPGPLAPGGTANRALAVWVVNWLRASASDILVKMGTKAERGSFW